MMYEKKTQFCKTLRENPFQSIVYFENSIKKIQKTY